MWGVFYLRCNTILAGSPLPNNTTLGYGLAEGIYSYVREIPEHVTGFLTAQFTYITRPWTYRVMSRVPFLKRYATRFAKDGTAVRIPLIAKNEEALNASIGRAVREVVKKLDLPSGWGYQVQTTLSNITHVPSQSLDDIFGNTRIRFRGKYLSKWSAVTKGLGFGFDFAIGAIVQGYNDWDNPYLTGGQKRTRSFTSGAGSGLFGLGGGAALGAVGIAICTPCGVVGAIAGGLGGGYVWGEHFQPAIFQLSPFSEERQLIPRGG